MPRSRVSIALALVMLAGCVPSLGPIRLAEIEGRLVDRDSREPISGAEIFQVYHGGGAPGGDPRVYHSRWIRTDGEGRFFFASKLSPSARMWLLATYGPRYDFYHPAYGLVRGPSTAASQLTLRGSLDDAPQRHMDLQVFCSSVADDAGSRHLRKIACPRNESR